MRNRIFATFLLLAAVAEAMPRAHAAEPADASAQRRESLQSILTTSSAQVVASLRKGCARGAASEWIQDNLNRGHYWEPDAVDQCVTILTRHGRDGTLDSIYRTILLDTVRSDAGAGALASEIGSYVLDKHITDIPLARGVALPVNTALAFDAGFTNGYRDTSKPKTAIEKLPGYAAIKPLAGRCLDLKESNTQGCYSAGYVYGLRAAHGELVAAAR